MHHNHLNSIPLILHIPTQYPFQEPTYTFEPPQGFLSKDSNVIEKPISDLLGDWNPGMKLSNIADLAITEIQKTLVHKSVVQTDWIYDSLSERNNYFWLVAFAVLLRVLVGLGGYSG